MPLIIWRVLPALAQEGSAVQSRPGTGLAGDNLPQQSSHFVWKFPGARQVAKKICSIHTKGNTIAWDAMGCLPDFAR